MLLLILAGTVWLLFVLFGGIGERRPRAQPAAAAED